MTSGSNITEKVQNRRRRSTYARNARYTDGAYGGGEMAEGVSTGQDNARISTTLQQQLSYKWLTFAHNADLELEYQRHHSSTWLPKAKNFGIGTTIICLLFAFLYGSQNAKNLWNVPLMLMVFGSGMTTIVLHLRDETDFSLGAEHDLECNPTKKPMPSSVCGRLRRCYSPLLNRCGLKQFQTDQRLQYLVSTAFAFVSSCHAIRAALDPRAPIHYVFSLTFVHPFYCALFGGSGFLTFPFYILTCATFTAFHALSFYVLRDLYVATYTPNPLGPDIRFRQEYCIWLPVNYCVNIIIFGLLNRGHEIASRREFMYMKRMEEENIELVKISVEASKRRESTNRANASDDMPRSSMIGGNPFSSILHFTRQLLRGVNQVDGDSSLDAQLEKVSSSADGGDRQKARSATTASEASALDIGNNEPEVGGIGDGRGARVCRQGARQPGQDQVQSGPQEPGHVRKRGSSWGGSTKKLQTQMPTPKRGSMLGHCAIKNTDGLEAGGVLLRLEDLELMQQLGEGSFGEVFKARLAGVDGLVAAKRAKLQVQKMNLSVIEEVLHECELMYELGKHPHVLPFVGAAVDADGPALYIVSKLMERGSVVDQLYLRKADLLADTADSSGVARGDSRGSSGAYSSRRRLGKKMSQAEEELGGCSCEGVRHEHCNRKFELTRLQMAADAADGVAYLHSQNVIHRDLACRNLLVEQDWTVSVADFGLSRMTKGGDNEDEEANGKTQTMIGPIKWESPETWTSGSKVYSTKTDVFSFGVCLYVMYAGGPPWEGVGNIEVATRVLQGERLRFPTDDSLRRYQQGRAAVGRLKKGLGQRPRSWRELPIGKVADAANEATATDEAAVGDGAQELSESVGKIAAACWLADPQCRPMMAEVSRQLAELHRNHRTGKTRTSPQHIGGVQNGNSRGGGSYGTGTGTSTSTTTTTGAGGGAGAGGTDSIVITITTVSTANDSADTTSANSKRTGCCTSTNSASTSTSTNSASTSTNSASTSTSISSTSTNSCRAQQSTRNRKRNQWGHHAHPAGSKPLRPCGDQLRPVECRWPHGPDRQYPARD
jgi:serine/threonine protein kinase